MSVPTIEELVETFFSVWSHDFPETAKPAMSAVLDRLKPVVAEAWIEGRLHRVADNIGIVNPDTAYATRTIDQIKGA